MQTRALGKSLVSSIFGTFGLSVCRTETLRKASSFERERERHLLLLLETDHLFRKMIFPSLPEKPKRLEMMTRLSGCSPVKAFHILNYLHLSLPLGGAVCEMGVGEGNTSALIASEILDENHPLWLFDSFQGLSKPTAKDVLLNDIFNLGSVEAYEGTMATPEHIVREKVLREGFPASRLHMVPGFIEQSAKSLNLPESVCFAYVDFDLYEPVLTALEMLDNRLPVGAHVIVDDIGWFSAGPQSAVEEFSAKHGKRYEIIRPVALTGGFVILARR